MNCNAKITINQTGTSIIITELSPSPSLCRNCSLVTVCPPLPTREVFAFTGLSLGMLPVTDITDDVVTLLKRDGKEIKFHISSGLQIDPSKPRYANHIKGGE